MSQDCADGLFEVMMQDARPFMAERKIAIVDATVIDLAQAAPVGDEDRGLRWGDHVGTLHERLMGVESRAGGDRELPVMGANDGRIIFGIGIDEPEANAIGCKL